MAAASNCILQIVFHINICHSRHGCDLLCIKHVFYWNFCKYVRYLLRFINISFYMSILQTINHNITIQWAIYVCNIVFVKNVIHTHRERYTCWIDNQRMVPQVHKRLPAWNQFGKTNCFEHMGLCWIFDKASTISVAPKYCYFSRSLWAIMTSIRV